MLLKQSDECKLHLNVQFFIDSEVHSADLSFSKMTKSEYEVKRMSVECTLP